MNLSKEEIEKAKKEGYEIIGNFKSATTEFTKDIFPKKAESIKTLLQYITLLEQENNKLNKIINEMAKEMYSNISMLEMAKIGQAIDYDPRKMFAGISDEEAIDCIKQYFEKKAEEK